MTKKNLLEGNFSIKEGSFKEGKARFIIKDITSEKEYVCDIQSTGTQGKDTVYEVVVNKA